MLADMHAQRFEEERSWIVNPIVENSPVANTPTLINGFDFDGVVSEGIHPGPNDVIITGRSWRHAPEVNRWLHERGIFVPVFYCHLPPRHTREESAEHKVRTISALMESFVLLGKFFEDDPVQFDTIKRRLDELKMTGSPEVIRVHSTVDPIKGANLIKP